MAHHSTRGGWRRSDRGRCGHIGFSVASRPRETCNYYRQHGSCKFGQGCKYSHDVESANSSASPRNRTQRQPDSIESCDSYITWRTFVRRPLSETTWEKILVQKAMWAEAVEILKTGSRQWHQAFARDLVDDKYNGGHFLRAVTDLRLDVSPQTIVDFFTAMTHPSILGIMSIDSYIGTAFSIFGGPNGARAIDFLTRTVNGLVDQLQGHALIHPQSWLGALLVLIPATLWELLRREQRSRFHEDVSALLNNLDRLFHTVDDELGWDIRRATDEHMEASRRVVDMSLRRLAAPEDIALLPLTERSSSTYSHIHTSSPGGRHDNDHVDIDLIEILPTADEILCDQSPYLPSTDVRRRHIHTNLVERFIDTHFRLLRHDIFGPLIDVVSHLVHSLQDGVGPNDLCKGDASMHLYLGATIDHLAVQDRGNVHIHVSFAMPPWMRKVEKLERQRFWETSRRLEKGAIVCFLSQQNGAFIPLLLKVDGTPEDREGSSSDSCARFSVPLEPASHSLGLWQHLIATYLERQRGYLIAVPGIIPATFEPILQNLQHMIGSSIIPFQHLIIPNPVSGSQEQPDVAPPLYARDPGFSFSLAVIQKNGGNPILIGRQSSEDDQSLIGEIENNTGLDCGQCRALIHGLRREVALIQGPPGTGKSHVGVKLVQTLLAARQEASLGPLILVCNTNHALDQFLLHLKRSGVKNFIRIGGRSRTDELDANNLMNVTDGTHKTSHERYIVASSKEKIDEEAKKLQQALANLHKMRKGELTKVLKSFLRRRSPRILEQIFSEDDDGFTIVSGDPVSSWAGFSITAASAGNGEPVDEMIESLMRRAERNVHSLQPQERRVLVQYWVDSLRTQSADWIFDHVEQIDDLKQRVRFAHDDANRRVLMDAEVIGITTTGLARDISMLRGVRSKVVVCEEAGEVLEAHMISTLMPSVQHLIQIGDHEQLRPQINNHSLSMETKEGEPYQLDRSQFERLAVRVPGTATAALPVARLNIQRRMRPCSSRLIHDIYPGLEDHASVSQYPDVVGMADNLFWLTHSHIEDKSGEGSRVKSRSNMWEVEMTKALVRHLIRQGAYTSEDIAVLTPYTGQLQKLRATLSHDFEIFLSDKDEDAMAKDGFIGEAEVLSGHSLHKRALAQSLRLATVDNFQGEEAKVVIISLVRSNEEKKVGFLRTTNRINVLLSRSQHGMYLIGAADTYAGIPMWRGVRQRLEETNSFGDAFRICCPRHQDTISLCRVPEDFDRYSPEGGCRLACDKRLEKCGHRCQTKCHSIGMHNAYVCPQPCPRLRQTCDHPCRKLCGEPCGTCLVPLESVALPCGHLEFEVPCFWAQIPDQIPCTTKVEKLVSRCGHEVTVGCRTEVESDSFACPTPCEALLRCGHQCRGRCAQCSDKDKGHPSCKKQCGRALDTCRHVCTNPCHEGPCPPCQKKCEVRCAHSRCSKPCSQACPPCVETCIWSCQHQGKCTMPCAAPCDRLPCNERCEQRLEACGHRCPGLCGEICPSGYCQECHERLDARVDMLEFKTYGDIDPDESPIVVLTCGHFFTAETLDGLVSMNEVYSVGQDSSFNGLREPLAMLHVPRCPDCNMVIQQFATNRYNRVINLAVMDEMTKKFIINGLEELGNMKQRIQEGEKWLLDNKPIVASAAVPGRRPSWRDRATDATTEERYHRCLQLERQIKRFCDRVGLANQPSRKLQDAVRHAQRRGSVQDEGAVPPVTETPASSHEQQLVLGGRLALLTVQSVILTDILTVVGRDDVFTTDREKMFKTPPQSLPSDFPLACLHLIDDATTANLHRISVEAALTYAQFAHSLRSFAVKHPGTTLKAAQDTKSLTDSAHRLLDDAARRCAKKFDRAQELGKAVENMTRLLGKDFYDPITIDELESIKEAMVAGPAGIASHSGHWYKCENGHVFAIGECGMPMEEARCPYCDKPIGGQNHVLAPGVERATEME